VGVPYSGERVSENVQTLVDGTKITQATNNEKLWRDSEGRTRTERQIGAGPISDGKSKLVLVEVRDPVAGFLYVLDDLAKVAHRFALTAGPAKRTPAAPETTAAQAPPKPRPQASSEQLGTQTIEGVLAEGVRSTRTIPIGEIGNDRPINTLNESWFSRELKETVLSKSSDPRFGEHTTRLTNISRSEPDPSMFTIPSGYSTVDEKDSFTMTLKKQ